MQHPFFRLLAAGCSFWFVALVLLAWSNNARAEDYHQYQSAAFAHCVSLIPTAEQQVPSQAGNIDCQETGSTQTCIGGGLVEGSMGMHSISGDYFYSTSQFSGDIERHAFCEYDPPPECEHSPGTQVTHYQTGTLPNPLPEDPLCHENCTYGSTGGPYQDCTFTDTNGNGVSDDGESYNCGIPYSTDGSACESGDPLGGAPGSGSGCSNQNCESDPDPGGGGSGGSSEGDPVDPQDPVDPNADDDDGNPDTPPGPGSGVGDGDVDGDGDRDIDCNPVSNPDCEFAGSGTGSGTCDSQPSCSGDPVQCAILYQEWAHMCYDGGSITNPTNCQADITCEGDVLLCEIIRQEREQYCDLYVGDGTNDTNVFNDADFGRDLKDEAELVDLPAAMDQSGFASGSCPPPMSVSVFGSNVDFSFDPFCQLAPLVRVLVILAALISAAFIVTGTRH